LTADENKEVVRQFYDAMNAHDSTAAASLWAEDAANHGRTVGRAGVEKLLGEIVQIHERSEVKEMVAEGEWVACRVVVSGTHRFRPTIPFDGGIYMVTTPDGRPFTTQHMHMYRVVDGKIREHWANRDDLGAARQLGLDLSPAEKQ